MTINEMIQKRAKVWETAKNFVDTHEDKNGVLNAEDSEAYSRMEKEIEDLTAAIDRQQRAEAREAELSRPVNAPLTGRPAKQEVDEKTGRASNAYKEDFGAHLRGQRPVHNVLSEGVQADGGYLVPEEFEDRRLSATADAGDDLDDVAVAPFEQVFDIGRTGDEFLHVKTPVLSTGDIQAKTMRIVNEIDK